jgi:multiple antibiotic resistance protein
MDQSFLNLYLKLFFILTPFFVTTIFLTMTKDFNERQRRRTAIRVTFAVIVICLILFFFGNYIFNIFGITIDAFRIGAGALLFLSAVGLVRSNTITHVLESSEDISVVPLAIPVTVGPATVGVLLIMGGETTSTEHKLLTIAALVTAILTVGLLLFLSSKLERWLGKRGLTILSKITGLILASMAAQMIFTGIKNFLF